MSVFSKIRFWIVGKILKLYWVLLRPVTIGVRALIVNDQNQVLLVKHRYLDGWYLPGGGVDKGEELLQALKRELKEELNLEIIKSPEFLGTYSNFYQHKNDYISIFVVREFRWNPEQNLEIEQWGMFTPDELPKTTSLGTVKRIQEYFEKRPINYIW